MRKWERVATVLMCLTFAAVGFSVGVDAGREHPKKVRVECTGQVTRGLV